jgi:hypothetical protein
MGAAAVAAVLIGSGCYVYEPVRPTDAILDARVRATVTPEQAAELAPVLRGVTPQVSGTLVQRTDAGVMLEVPLYGATPGTSRPVRNRVSIPFSDLVGLEARRLSTWRTAVSVGAVVAGVAGGWAFVGGSDSVDDKPKTDIDNAIITIFRLPVALFR